jgi:hypothetical protein
LPRAARTKKARKKFKRAAKRHEDRGGFAIRSSA